MNDTTTLLQQGDIYKHTDPRGHIIILSDKEFAIRWHPHRWRFYPLDDPDRRNILKTWEKVS